MKTESGNAHKLLEAMTNEMKKEHPRKEIILPLMKNCFTERRDFVMNEALSTRCILEKYPALKLASVLSENK